MFTLCNNNNINYTNIISIFTRRSNRPKDRSTVREVARVDCGTGGRTFRRFYSARAGDFTAHVQETGEHPGCEGILHGTF